MAGKAVYPCRWFLCATGDVRGAQRVGAFWYPYGDGNLTRAAPGSGRSIAPSAGVGACMRYSAVLGNGRRGTVGRSRHRATAPWGRAWATGREPLRKRRRRRGLGRHFESGTSRIGRRACKRAYARSSARCAAKRASASAKLLVRHRLAFSPALTTARNWHGSVR